VFFFCLSWFQKKEKKPKPQIVYDDELDDDDEEEETAPVAVTAPPRYNNPVRSQNSFTNVSFQCSAQRD
jgi:hypothetical protein